MYKRIISLSVILTMIPLSICLYSIFNYYVYLGKYDRKVKELDKSINKTKLEINNIEDEEDNIKKANAEKSRILEIWEKRREDLKKDL